MILQVSELASSSTGAPETPQIHRGLTVHGCRPTCNLYQLTVTKRFPQTHRPLM